MTDVELIKEKIDIVSFINDYVPLKKAGRNFKACCPFHNEKTPSFTVSPERQSWHCFGACQTGGDAFGFLMKMENVEFGEALKVLAKRTGVTLKSYEPTEVGKQRDKIYEINHLASEYYHYILTTHPVGETGREYFKSRQISDGSIRLFKLGYAPKAWDSLIKYLTKKGYTTAELNLAGLVSVTEKGHFFDRFRGRVMFTLFDHRDNVVGFAGRLLDAEAKEAKYINTAETPVYTKGNVLFGLNVSKDEIRKANRAVVVEGEIDAIQSFQAGVKNVVAIKGTALTEAQVNLLKRYAGEIILSLDADFAGDAAARRGIEIASNADLNIKIATPLAGKDPDECVRQGTGLWKESVDKAVSFYDFVISSALGRFDKNEASGKAKIVAETAKFLTKIDNSVVKEHYVKKLAAVLGTAEEAVNTELDKAVRRESLSVNIVATMSVEPVSRLQTLEEYLLSLILQSEKPLDEILLIKSRLVIQDFSSTAGKIYEALLVAEEPFATPKFIAGLPTELQSLADRFYLDDVSRVLNNPELLLSEISKTVWEIKELSLKAKLQKLSNEIKSFDDNPELNVKFDEISSQLQKLLKDKETLGVG